MTGKPIEVYMQREEVAKSPSAVKDAGAVYLRLSRTFWLLVLSHVVAFALLIHSSRPFDLESWLAMDTFRSPFSTLPFGGVGTLAIWFAWSDRTIVQRLTRASAAIGCVVGAMYLTQHPRTIDLDWIVEAPFLLLGALAASVPFSVLGKARLAAPGERAPGGKLSIRRVMLITLLFAVWLAASSAIVDSVSATMLPGARQHFFSNAWMDLMAFLVFGILLGGVSAGCAWFVFQFEDTIVLFSAIVVLLIGIMLTANLGANGGLLLNLFGAAVSPYCSLWVLKRVGYGLVWRQ